MSNNKNWDHFLVKAKEVGKAVGETASNVVDESKKKLDELKLRRDISDSYEVLGRLYYRGCKSEEQDDKKIAEVVSGIDKLEERLAKLKAERAARKPQEEDDISCPHCGGMNRANARYCSYCGKKIKD